MTNDLREEISKILGSRADFKDVHEARKRITQDLLALIKKHERELMDDIEIDLLMARDEDVAYVDLALDKLAKLKKVEK